MSVANFCRKQRELNMVRLLNAHKSPHTVYEGGMVCVGEEGGTHEQLVGMGVEGTLE